MFKTYVCSLVSLSTEVRYGDGYKRIEFTGGTYGGGQFTGGRIVTNDPLLQEGIERTERFKKNQIQIQSTRPEPGEVIEKIKVPEKKIEVPEIKVPKVKVPEVKVPEKYLPEAEIFTEATNTQQARNILIGKSLTVEFTAKAADVVLLAKKNNVAFPNWESFNK